MLFHKVYYVVSHVYSPADLFGCSAAQQPNSDLGRLVLRFLDHTQLDTHLAGLL
jgi:hypothetical protein